jgi:Protein of unknown function (DUF1648)
VSRTIYRSLVVLLWLVLPFTAWGYYGHWDQLPARMAVHFNANWQPNGYTTREGAVMLGLGIMAFLLLVFTLAMLIIHAQKPAAAWPALVISYIVLGVCWYGNHMIVDFNLHASAHSELVGPTSPTKSDSQDIVLLHS